MKKAAILNIYGRVQGVGFRYKALEKANELGICGYVKNLSDGSVFIEAEAEDIELQLFIAWCRNGPSYSRVEKVGVQECPLQHFKGFIIK